MGDQQQGDCRTAQPASKIIWALGVLVLAMTSASDGCGKSGGGGGGGGSVDRRPGGGGNSAGDRARRNGNLNNPKQQPKKW